VRREQYLTVGRAREHRPDQRVNDETVIDMILRLIDDEQPVSVAQDQRQHHGAALTRR
jgi:predicted GNAT family acetyltransferase